MTRPERVVRAIRRTAVLASAAALAAALGAPHAAAQEDDDDPIAGVREVVVKLDPAAGATIEEINSTYGTSTLDTLLGSAGIHLLAVPEGSAVDDIAEAMDEDPRLVYAEPNFTQSAPEGASRFASAWNDSDPSAVRAERYGSQYAVTQLGLPAAHAVTRGAGVVVAVLDTGVQLDHPLLAGRTLGGGYDVVDDDPDPSEAANGVDDDADGKVDEGTGHGTHVAGAALLVAPDARILPMRVLDSEGNGSVFTTAEAVNLAVASGADVINMSFGSTARSELLEEVEGDADESGAVLVAAAGNLASTERQYPAAAEDTVAVTATDVNGVRAPFANSGPWIDVAAPGDDIVSALPVGAYAEWDGTSMAAPLVAGEAALVLAVRPRSPEEVTALVRRTAVRIDSGSGAGRIDVAAAVRAAAETGGEDGEGD
ncbi:S8 family serine peptidase [Pseudonocardia nigra]|uniref:S8 family serine peptidase n=1 Tax=Pseudonocardia nigra TaxID=1921578 RepID=UPI001C5E231D|nr:S8 family serine peptidase [Pseudonocardia nigra]